MRRAAAYDDPGGGCGSRPTRSAAGWSSRNGDYALYLRGYERSPITNLNITDASSDNVTTPMLLENVSGLHLSDVTSNGVPYDTR
ncbi:MAG: hypothetical protein GEV11_08170 [Streptosporangiales bacterium]|nr:hypothetical protein [Streptosporangiales bacterium]